MAQLWGTNSLGGYMYSDKLSKTLRTALQPGCKFRQFADAKDGTEGTQGKALHNGDTFHWNVYSDVATQGTTITETEVMPETNFTITQGTLTITQAGNSVPFTSKLDDLSEHPIKEIIGNALKKDGRKFFDTQAHAQFNATPLIVQPATSGASTTAVTLYTDGTATNTNTVHLLKAHVGAIVDIMKERSIEPYLDDNYFSISWPTTFRSFKNELESVHQYVDTGFQMILYGEIGKYEGVRFVEQNNVAKGTLTGTGGWAFFFGGDTVAEAFVVPEEIRGKIPTNYGLSKGIAWYYLGGFGLCHTSAMGTDQVRILKWTTL